jgi:tetratricopeptide (TPR) repeat protein
MIEEQLFLTNPFPGLRRFEMSEGHLFFGRDGHCDALLEKLRTKRFATVVGTSGSGKSSLVRAGLLPALTSGFMRTAGANWKIAIFRPGNNPISNLAKALNASDVSGANDGAFDLGSSRIEATLRHSSLGLIETVRQAATESQENLLVVVDQFEELYRFQADSAEDNSRDEADAFVKLLLEAVGQKELPIYIVLTIRSEYLGESARFWGLPEAINEGQYLIPRMTDDERRETIVGPITLCGGEITVPLINRLLNDAGHCPNQLPILQHALMRTWEDWKRTTDGSEPLDIRHYEKVGGMANALSLHADEAYDELSDLNRRVAEKLFKCLTDKGAVGGGNRRHATLGNICDVAEASLDEVIKVVEAFRGQGRSFLMPSPGVALQSETPIDISHESLIGGWERLKGWVSEEADSARIYVRLADDAVFHRDGKAALLINPGLQVALDWRAQYQPNKAWAQRYKLDFELAMNYLEESQRQRDIEVTNKRKSGRRWLIVSWGVAILFGLLAAVALLSFRQARRGQKMAEEQKTIAEGRGQALMQKEVLLELYHRIIIVSPTKYSEAKAKGLVQDKTEPPKPNLSKDSQTTSSRNSDEQQTKSLGSLTIEHLALMEFYDQPSRSGIDQRAPTDSEHLFIARSLVKLMVEDKSEDLPAALEYIEQVSKRILTKSDARQRDRVIDVDLGDLGFDPAQQANFYVEVCDLVEHSKFRKKSDAIPFYDRAVALLKDNTYAKERASTLIKKGDFLRRIKRENQALESYNQARVVYELEAARNASLGCKGQAQAFENLGNVYKRLGQCEDALKSYDKALQCYRELKETDRESSIRTEINQVKDCKQ